MKKSIFFLTLGLFLALAMPVQAINLPNQGQIEKEIREDLREMNQEIKETRKEIREDIQNIPTGTPFWNKLKEKFPKLLMSGLNQGKITSISGTTFPAVIKVSQDNKEVTLNLTDKTVILRKFGGKSSLSELHIGDIVSARGKWQSSDKAVLDVRVLRNLSVQKRNATFWGTIKSKATDSFQFQTQNRGEQKVFVGQKTKIVSRDQKEMAYTDLKVGDRVRVTGLWDSALNQIEEVKLIKNWSVGPVNTPTP